MPNQPTAPIWGAMEKTYSLRRYLRLGMPAWMFKGLLSGGILAFMAATLHANLYQRQGMVGVVGEKAAGLPLSCGETYNPQDMVIFDATAPCGSVLTVINPQTGEGASGKVVHTNLVYGAAYGRVADISPALARAIGVNPHGQTAQRLTLRWHGNAWRALAAQTPVVPFMPVQQASLGELNSYELATLADNMLGECGNCGTLGMVAVAQVTQNRVDMAYNGKKTIRGVVYDANQFNWTVLNPTLKSAKPNKRKARKLAADFLHGRLSGNALAVQYVLGRQAVNFYAPALTQNPGWGRSGRLEEVPMSRHLQAELRHSFYRTKLIQTASR